MDQIEAYDIVSVALARRPREALIDAASRVRFDCRSRKRWPVAMVVLGHDPGSPALRWAKVYRAAQVALNAAEKERE